MLGYIGAMELPSDVNYGYGFVYGADAAARDLGLSPGDVIINYHYTDSYIPNLEIQATAVSWFSSGTEVIFSGVANIGTSSILLATEQAGGKMIGVDLDQSDLSHAVITSAVKNIDKAAYDLIRAFYSGEFPGGRIIEYNAANHGIGLPMDTSRFSAFSIDDYNVIYSRVASEEFDIPTYGKVDSIEDIRLNVVVVCVVG
jgi:basic membrane protein A